MSPAAVGLSILVLAVVLLGSNRVRFDVVAVVVLALLGLSGDVHGTALFAGFSATPTIVIAAMLVLGGGLRHTGAIDVLARGMLRAADRWPRAFQPLLYSVPALPSAFVSDVGLMGIMLPTVLSLRRRLRLGASQLLMPLAIAIALGGLLSMVGSAGNIIANGELTATGRRPLGLFAITPLGLAVVAAGVACVLTFGRWLLPKVPAGGDDAAASGPSQRLLELDCLAEVGAPARQATPTPAAGQAGDGGEEGLCFVGVVDDEGVTQPWQPAQPAVGDERLLVRAPLGQLLASGLLERRADEPHGANGTDGGRDGDLEVVELLVPPSSALAGQTLRAGALPGRLGLDPFALAWRRDLRPGPLDDLVLREGDVILATPRQGRRPPPTVVARRDLLVLGGVEHHLRPATWRTALSVVVVAGALGLVAFNALPLTVALVAGAVALVLTGCLPLDDAYRAIDWRLVFLLGGFIPLGNLLRSSGVIAHAGRILATTAGRAGPEVVLATFFVLAALLTQVLSNAATALVLSPLAVSVAGAEHLSPVPLLMAVVVAVSASPLTPLANKVYLMTTGPGGYRYRDFLRLGTVVTAAALAVTLVMVPLLFPFH